MRLFIPSRSIVLLLLALTSLVALSGCSDDDDPMAIIAPSFTRDPAVLFTVRDAATINPGNMPGSFGGSNNDQGMIEFPLDFESTARVEITVRVRDALFGPMDPLLEFQVAT